MRNDNPLHHAHALYHNLPRLPGNAGVFGGWGDALMADQFEPERWLNTHVKKYIEEYTQEITAPLHARIAELEKELAAANRKVYMHELRRTDTGECDNDY